MSQRGRASGNASARRTRSAGPPVAIQAPVASASGNARGARAPLRGGAAGAPPAPRVPAAPAAPHPSVCVLCQEAVPASHAAACPKNRGLPLPSALFLGARSTAAKQLLEAVAARAPPPSPGPRAAVRVAGPQGRGAGAGAGRGAKRPRQGRRASLGSDAGSSGDSDLGPGPSGSDPEDDDLAEAEALAPPVLRLGPSRAPRSGASGPPPTKRRHQPFPSPDDGEFPSFIGSLHSVDVAQAAAAVKDVASALVKGASALAEGSPWAVAQIPIMAAFSQLHTIVRTRGDEHSNDEVYLNLTVLRGALWGAVGVPETSAPDSAIWDNPGAPHLASLAGQCNATASALSHTQGGGSLPLAPAPPGAPAAFVTRPATLQFPELESLPIGSVAQVAPAALPGIKAKPLTVVKVAFRLNPVPLSSAFDTRAGASPPTIFLRILAARLGLPTPVVTDPTFQRELTNDIVSQFATSVPAANAFLSALWPPLSLFLDPSSPPSKASLQAAARLQAAVFSRYFAHGRLDPANAAQTAIYTGISTNTGDPAAAAAHLAFLDRTMEMWGEVAILQVTAAFHSSAHLAPSTDAQFLALLPAWADVSYSSQQRDVSSALNSLSSRGRPGGGGGTGGSSGGGGGSGSAHGSSGLLPRPSAPWDTRGPSPKPSGGGPASSSPAARGRSRRRRSSAPALAKTSATATPAAPTPAPASQGTPGAAKHS